jgi:hypothetical protein
MVAGDSLPEGMRIARGSLLTWRNRDPLPIDVDGQL